MNRSVKIYRKKFVPHFNNKSRDFNFQFTKLAFRWDGEMVHCIA